MMSPQPTTLPENGNKASPRILLLFGSPRSGTSWLAKIFDSHPQTLYKHEPDRSGFGLPFAPSIETAEHWRTTIQRFVATLAANNTHHVAARLPVFQKSYRKKLAQPIHKFSVLGSGVAAVFGRNWPVFQCANINDSQVRLIWKSTDSLGRLGIILRALDDCRAIHILRHPCGYISSVLRGEAQHQFITKVPTSEDYRTMQTLLDTCQSRRRGLRIDRLRDLHPVERMAWMWVLVNEKARDDARGDSRYVTVRYEDVCRDPINRVGDLFSVCGLDWDRQTAEFLRASTLEYRPAGLNRITQDSRRYYSIFRNPIASADKWKSEMKPEDIQRVFRVVRQSDLASLYPETESLEACTRA
jgi:hypothetical protein